MKGKVKLDVAAIKGWFLAHGEKLAFGIVGLLVLMLIYSTLQRESLDAKYEPLRMQELASQVSEHVKNSNWDANREQVKVVNYAERAKSEPLPAGSYAIALPLNRPVADPKAKRGQPEVFAVEEMRVAAGMDLFLAKQQGGSSSDQGGAKAQPWAVVTALVPYEKQRTAFDAAFAEAIEYNANRDTPQYLKPVLERAEVNSANGQVGPWAPIADLGLGDEVSKRADIVQAKFLWPTLTAPLAELVPGGQWGEAVAHPKVPLLSETGSDQLGASAKTGAASAESQAPPTAAEGGPAIPHLLLRLFDYTVQPGRKYRYRVTLAVANPNLGIPPQYLEKPESANLSTLASQPTEASALVTIPDGHDVVAGPVDGGTRYTEPTAKMLVTAIDSSAGLKAATELDVRRGTVANTGPVNVKVPDPLSKTPKELSRSFESNFMVLDIHGGKDVTRRKHDPPLTSPGEILLLDANGNMTVRSELEDRDQFANLVIREAPVAKPVVEKDKEKKGPRIIGGDKK